MVSDWTLREFNTILSLSWLLIIFPIVNWNWFLGAVWFETLCLIEIKQGALGMFSPVNENGQQVQINHLQFSWILHGLKCMFPNITISWCTTYVFYVWILSLHGFYFFYNVMILSYVIVKFKKGPNIILR